MKRSTVSVILCTRNRAESLRQTLASITSTNIPPDLDVELVVVDNGSTDATPEVVAQCSSRPELPVRPVFEPAPGLSNARNAGLRHTRSEVIVFTDDDVRVPADWLARVCGPIIAGEADAVAGGVHFPPEYEAFLSKEPFRSRRGWLASTEGFDPVTPHTLVGANMAFSRRLAEALGGFDPALGAGALGFGEESFFAERLVDAGFRMRSALEVSVAHHFDLSRLTEAALLKMAERMGRSMAYLDYHWNDADARSTRSHRVRAKLLLVTEQALKPWRRFSGRQLWQLTQRVLTLAYWQQLATYRDQPRRYLRKLVPAAQPSTSE